jgi:hypothetical protein
MFWLDQETTFVLRPKTGPQFQSDVESKTDDAPSPEDATSWIVCRQCRKRLTKASHGLSIEGSHTHTFANPSGIVIRKNRKGFAVVFPQPLTIQ